LAAISNYTLPITLTLHFSLVDVLFTEQRYVSYLVKQENKWSFPNSEAMHPRLANRRSFAMYFDTHPQKLISYQ
jgi:hypothetical protein